MAAALALATAPAFAQTYSQTVFFGDSLTDSGYFRPALVAVNPSAAILGRFTTNPGLVWSEHVANYYGTDASSISQGGSNYAIGGARVATDRAGPTPALPTLSLKSQIAAHLAANGGRADANALYTTWGGANDLFAAAEAARLGATPQQVQAIVGAAVAAQVSNVATLEAAGARYVLVANIPDLGITPQFGANALVSAQATALATGYNDALFGGLASAGLRVIPLDTFHLLREIVANPAPYGITNTTGTACLIESSLTCNPATYATPSAPDTYAFADGVHPSTKAHAILGDYAISVLEAPRQLSVLPHSAATTGRARADRVAAQVGVRPGAEGEGMRWWADVRGDSQRYGHGDNYDGIVPALSAGVDWARGNLVFGGFGGYGQGKIDWGNSGGNFDQTDASLGGYLGWNSGAAWVNGQVSYTWLSYDVERQVKLGPTARVHSGSPDGSNITAAVQGGWNFQHGALTHGPVLSLVSQTIDIDGYAENSTEATALAFSDQKFDSLIGSAGWQVDYAINEHLKPYARLTYDREFEETDEEVFAQLRSMPGTAPYAVPGQEFDRNYGTLTFGARTQLFGLQANLGTSLTVGQKGGNDTTVFVSVGSGF
ncbi:autotransporter domain-containing protein [Lysobacter cavernae]|uniref:Autotransporter domain-containing protein n=1 Tax=Lysobacter cavernae TaxID=1685901 RepID=A0ABV7RQA5_9GAMM